MHRFFVPHEAIISETAVISDCAQVHHLKDVLRIKPGEQVVIFDEEGREYVCEVKSLSKRVTLGICGKKGGSASGKGLRLTMGCAVLKGRGMDDLFDKLTQTGVEHIIPLTTARSVSRIAREKEDVKLRRWERICLAAVKQSKGALLPVISAPRGLEEAAGLVSDCELKLIATVPRQGIQPLPLRVACQVLKPQSAAVFVGPEGDFTDEEVCFALESGFKPVSLGRMVLRAETAAVAAASFLKLYFHETD